MLVVAALALLTALAATELAARSRLPRWVLPWVSVVVGAVAGYGLALLLGAPTRMGEAAGAVAGVSVTALICDVRATAYPFARRLREMREKYHLYSVG